MPENITQSVGGKFVALTAEFARPANTTAYTAGDVVSGPNAGATVLSKFVNAVRLPGGSAAVVKARLTTDNNADASSYRLHLYTVPETGLSALPPVDNAPDTTLYADRSKYLGFIDFPALTKAAGTDTAATAVWTGGVGSTTEPSGPLPIVANPAQNASTASGDVNVYGKLVVLSALTPTSGQNYSIELTFLQN